MSQQLVIGKKLDLATLQSRWLKNTNDSGFQIKISQNIKSPIARYFSVCFSAPKTGWKAAYKAGNCCPYHIKAKGPNTDELTVISLDLNHTCCDDPNVPPPERKRNYNAKDISTISDTLDVYQPTREKEGNTKQFIEMAKASTGFTMKTGQASKAVRAKRHDTIEAQIGQYFFIPSMIEAHRESDPRGTYVLQASPCVWNSDCKQFFRAHACLSIAKHFWRKSAIRMFICDGTFTRLRAFKHIILLAVTFDANNQIIILAFMACEIENADNWVYFKEKLDIDFPGCEVWMSDADKGVMSEDFTLSLSQMEEDAYEKSRCARHLSENCKENNPGKMNEDDKLKILSLAKARTEEVYQKRLAIIRKEREDWANWLDERKDEFATVSFLQKDIRRWGKVTSNGVENTNSAIVAERSLPIMHLMQGLVKHQQEKYVYRKNQAAEWIEEGKTPSAHAEEQDKEIGERANKRTVENLRENHPIYKANVSVGENSGWTSQFIEVSVNVEEKTSDCPCKNYDETGANCHHVKALLVRLGSIGTGAGWYHERYHATTYSNSYGSDVPSMALAGKLKHDDSFPPLEFKQMAGRPPKKRKERPELRKTDVKRRCKGCGELGHFEGSKACVKPSTECRIKQHLAGATLHCQNVVKKRTPRLKKISHLVVNDIVFVVLFFSQKLDFR